VDNVLMTMNAKYSGNTDTLRRQPP